MMHQSDYDYLMDVTSRYHHGEISFERYKEAWDMIMKWKREEQGGEVKRDFVYKGIVYSIDEERVNGAMSK